MKRLNICVCLVAMACTAVGDTIVGPRIIPSCSSSADLLITITGAHKPVGGVRVDVYRRVENGERSYWTGQTGPNGRVRPKELEPGEYRVFADAGKRTGDMILLVGAFKTPIARCEMKIGTPYSADAGSPLPDSSNEIALYSFRGLLVDEKKVPIPYVIVTVYRSGEVDHLIRIQADERGRFGLHLDKGSYIAFFAYQAFRAREMFFRVSDDGWQGCELVMAAEDSVKHDLPRVEWSGGL